MEVWVRAAAVRAHSYVTPQEQAQTDVGLLHGAAISTAIAATELPTRSASSPHCRARLVAFCPF